MAPGRVLYRGGDPSTVHEIVASRLGAHRLVLTGGGRLGADFRVLHEGDVSMYQLRYGAVADMRLDRHRQGYLVRVDRTGRGRAIPDGGPESLSASVLVPDRPAVLSWKADTTALIVRIRADVLHEAARRRFGGAASRPLNLGPTLDPADVAVRRWLTLVCGFGAMLHSGHPADSPSAARRLERLLVHGLLACRSGAGKDPLTPDDAPAEPDGLRRALEYCAEHVTEPVSVAAVAAAAGMSVRTLQEKFRTHLGVTPIGHLRRLRLARAHEDLLTASAGRTGDTVTDIALRWGFSHLGRFGPLYRETYGQLPSQTLRYGPRAEISRATG